MTTSSTTAATCARGVLAPFGRIGKGFGRVADTPLTKAGLTAWMVALRERGLTRGGINVYVRTGYSPISHTRGI
jgi:hypothetical protein